LRDAKTQKGALVGVESSLAHRDCDIVTCWETGSDAEVETTKARLAAAGGYITLRGDVAMPCKISRSITTSRDLLAYSHLGRLAFQLNLSITV
jgi:hypothetical protein